MLEIPREHLHLRNAMSNHWRNIKYECVIRRNDCFFRRIGLCGFENPLRDSKTDEVKRHIGHVSFSYQFPSTLSYFSFRIWNFQLKSAPRMFAGHKSENGRPGQRPDQTAVKKPSFCKSQSKWGQLGCSRNHPPAKWVVRTWEARQSEYSVWIYLILFICASFLFWFVWLHILNMGDYFHRDLGRHDKGFAAWDLWIANLVKLIIL